MQHKGIVPWDPIDQIEENLLQAEKSYRDAMTNYLERLREAKEALYFHESMADYFKAKVKEKELSDQLKASKGSKKRRSSKSP